MSYLLFKAALSGLIVAAVSEISRRFPGLGGLIASLPLVSVLGMIWLWRDTHDPQQLAMHASATFWFVLPSLPMFLAIPALLKRELDFGLRSSAVARSPWRSTPQWSGSDHASV